MARFALTELAIDLSEIHSYITIESELSIADKFVDELFYGFDLLAANKRMGIALEDIHPELRRFVYRRYLIFYIPTSYGVEIQRVLHSARDIPKLFENDFIN